MKQIKEKYAVYSTTQDLERFIPWRSVTDDTATSGDVNET